MNDPHVVSLHYEVVSSPDVTFNAPPLDHSTPEFDLHLAEGQVTFTLKGHHSSEEEARKVVEPFVRAWVISSGLATSPEHFRLKFSRAEIIDRAPPQGRVKSATGTARGGSTAIAAGHTIRNQYFPPPQKFTSSLLVEDMYYRWDGYRAGRIPLATAAYFCLTMLQNDAGGRPAAASKFNIGIDVLVKVSDLAATKGGREARKAKGVSAEFSAEERVWL